MSIIRTAPPNRYPIVTELHRFDEKVIKDAISYEVSRGGQVFFIHNRVDNIRDIQYMIHRLIPGIKSCVGHGQMSGEELETVMHDFVRGDYDVLIATTIVESGLDIPNANTIIINQAQNYGLSDLHQLRGRVGRSNRKAFCYLLAPAFGISECGCPEAVEGDRGFQRLGEWVQYCHAGFGYSWGREYFRGRAIRFYCRSGVRDLSKNSERGVSGIEG